MAVGDSVSLLAGPIGFSQLFKVLWQNGLFRYVRVEKTFSSWTDLINPESGVRWKRGKKGVRSWKKCQTWSQKSWLRPFQFGHQPCVTLGKSSPVSVPLFLHCRKEGIREDDLKGSPLFCANTQRLCTSEFLNDKNFTLPCCPGEQPLAACGYLHLSLSELKFDEKFSHIQVSLASCGRWLPQVLVVSAAVGPLGRTGEPNGRLQAPVTIMGNSGVSAGRGVQLSGPGLSRVSVGRGFGTDAPPECCHTQEALEKGTGPGWRGPRGGAVTGGMPGMPERRAWGQQQPGAPSGEGRLLQEVEGQNPDPCPWVQDRVAAAPLARSVSLGQFLSPRSLHFLMGERGEMREGFYGDEITPDSSKAHCKC